MCFKMVYQKVYIKNKNALNKNRIIIILACNSCSRGVMTYTSDNIDKKNKSELCFLFGPFDVFFFFYIK